MVVWPICVKIGAGVGQGSLGANEIYQNIKDVYGSDLFRFRESKLLLGWLGWPSSAWNAAWPSSGALSKNNIV